MWGGEALATVFVFARLGIRIRSFRKLYSDDIMVILSWVCSMAGCIIWQMIVRGLYDQYKLSAGELQMTPDVIQRELDLLRGSLAYLLLYNTCLYGIKASILLFFRRLDSKYQGPRRKWWWFVAAFTFVAYVTTVGTNQFKCLLSSLTYIFSKSTLHQRNCKETS